MTGAQGEWPDVVKLPKGIGAAPKPRRAAAPALQHALEAMAFGVRCSRCCRQDPAAGETCKPHPIAMLVLGHLGRFAVVNGHRLWRTGEYVWCEGCVAHTKRVVRELAKPCSGHSQHAWVRRNLRAGRAPKARVVTNLLGMKVDFKRKSKVDFK